MFERLGIGEAMKAKTKAQKARRQMPQAVAKGEAELGIFLTNVLMAPAWTSSAHSPTHCSSNLVFTAGVAADSKEIDAAKAFIDYLKTPAAAAAIKAKGMSPG